MSRVKKTRSSPAVPVQSVVSRKKRWRPPFWMVITTILLIVAGGVITYGVLVMTTWDSQQHVANMRDMTRQVGIVNDRESPLVIANSINSEPSVNGAIILFAGSITSQTQDTIRIGYKAPNGDSYILSVPVKRVIFHQEVGVKPAGKFHFDDWNSGYTLQDNIDMQFGDHLGDPLDTRITVNLTPEQFQKLVQG
ncbi:MAG: hypothetical protein JWN12_685 [Candidatus Saccharibacteria bacterium]|nr:hypothetical protein [Candidatus Saccharibacteria bacterium]